MASKIFERVQNLVRRIPRGKVATYGQLSQLIGGRLSPVGIGWALHAAPPGRWPWHRGANSRGTLSTEGEEPGLQRAMLETEGVRFGERGAIDLERWQWRPRRRKERIGRP